MKKLLRMAVLFVLTIVAPLPAVSTSAAPSPSTSSFRHGRWPLPSWARAPPAKGAQIQQRQCVHDVADANRTRVTYDMVLYGDQFTHDVRTKYASLLKLVAPRSLALGVDNSTVEELFWRVRAGGEKLRVSPRVVVVQIGLQNVRSAGRSPLSNIDYLLKYLKYGYDGSEVVLMGLMPDAKHNVTELNAQFKHLAHELGIKYSACGTRLRLSNSLWFNEDGQPTLMAHAWVLACLRQRLLSAFVPSRKSVALHQNAAP